jgi:hydroxycarboxylate dehydrogenase B
MLGTDPFAVGIPADPPVIVDFATAAVAEGKLRLERVAGRRVPEGLIQDADGRPSTDPEDYYAGGSLLPFGGHKGYGLALTIELLGGALSGNHVGFLPEYEWGNGFVLLVLDPAAFPGAPAYAGEIARACAGVRDSPPAAGVDRVLLPGDVERRTRAERARTGIPVPAGVWAQLEETAAALGVTL